MPHRMKCSEYRRLLSLYAEATERLAEMTTNLAAEAAHYESDEFARAWEHCESGRKLCTDIRRQLYEHVEQHRCALNLPAVGDGRD